MSSAVFGKAPKATLKFSRCNEVALANCGSDFSLPHFFLHPHHPPRAPASYQVDNLCFIAVPQWLAQLPCTSSRACPSLGLTTRTKIPSSARPLHLQVGHRPQRWLFPARGTAGVARLLPLHKTWGPLHFLGPILILNFPSIH